MITDQQKKDITAKLRKFVGNYPSQKQACQSLDDISEATIIQMLNNKWGSISERKWITVAKQIGVMGAKGTKVYVETRVSREVYGLLNTSRRHGAMICVTGRAGLGKSMAAQAYANASLTDTFYVQCRTDWGIKDMFKALLKAMRKDDVYGNLTHMIDEVVKEVKRIKAPLIILDEIDKLLDKPGASTVLRHLVTLYNELNGYCGISLTCTNTIENFIKRGVERQKIGFEEIYSRIGSGYLRLNKATDHDIKMLCAAYGITEEKEVYTIINEIKGLKGDLRRFDANVVKVETFNKKEEAA
ncbi:MAG: AAA family ATPase [Agriterribacter sp.]